MTSFFLDDTITDKAVENEALCPYIENRVDICMASFSLLKTDGRRRIVYCNTENYDDCPFFISKTLRNCSVSRDAVHDIL